MHSCTVLHARVCTHHGRKDTVDQQPNGARGNTVTQYYMRESENIMEEGILLINRTECRET